MQGGSQIKTPSTIPKSEQAVEGVSSNLVNRNLEKQRQQLKSIRYH